MFRDSLLELPGHHTRLDLIDIVAALCQGTGMFKSEDIVIPDTKLEILDIRIQSEDVGLMYWLYNIYVL